MKVIHNLKPIYSKYSKILILGSLPSIKSRENNFYYANKYNRFWKIMSKLFNVEFNNNEEKINFLITNNIALWDVIKSCDINKSSDSSIKNIKTNNIENIIKNSNIQCIFLIGRKSFEIYENTFKEIIKINYFYLPSSSSANASKSIDKLVNDYKIILKYLK